MLFAMSAIWAGNFFVLKNALDFVDPITFSFLRAFLGGAFVLALGGYKMKELSRRNVAMLSFIGLFNVSLFQILLNDSFHISHVISMVKQAHDYPSRFVVRPFSGRSGLAASRSRNSQAAASASSP